MQHIVTGSNTRVTKTEPQSFWFRVYLRENFNVEGRFYKIFNVEGKGLVIFNVEGKTFIFFNVVTAQ